MPEEQCGQGETGKGVNGAFSGWAAEMDQEGEAALEKIPFGGGCVCHR